jgi:hypothetical protein
MFFPEPLLYRKTGRQRSVARIIPRRPPPAGLKNAAGLQKK